ncbi:MAG: hypothetical protein WCF20_05460 [Methylovirgula sp.]
MNSVLTRLVRLIQAGGLKHGTAPRAQARRFGFHAGCNTTNVGDFRRTKPEGISRAGLALLGRYFEGSRARDSAQAEASNQDDATSLTDQQADAVDAHERSSSFDWLATPNPYRCSQGLVFDPTPLSCFPPEK